MSHILLTILLYHRVFDLPLQSWCGGGLTAYRTCKYFPTSRWRPVDWYAFHLALLKKSLYSCADGVGLLRILNHTICTSNHNIDLLLSGGHMWNWGLWIHSLGMWDGSMHKIHAVRFLVHSGSSCLTAKSYIGEKSKQKIQVVWDLTPYQLLITCYV